MEFSVLIDVAGLLVNGVGLTFVAVQVRLARRQASDAEHTTEVERGRAKRQATVEFYSSTLRERGKLRSRMPGDFDAAGIKRLVAESENDHAVALTIREYLSYLETLAAAVRSDVLDLETVDRLAGSRVMAISTNYSDYIHRRRRETGSDTLYEELEWLSEQISLRRGTVR